jgi:glutamate-1-semialdehyde 2,1-aminomutase
MLEKFKAETPKSRGFWKRSKKVFAGGINHNIRTFGLDRCGAYPPFINRGKGSHIWDIDGNEYIDWWMTHFSAILGHNHPSVEEAIVKQVQNGHHFGALNPFQVEFAESLASAIPFLRKMRFCSTGAEATMYTVRLARLFTGRRLVAKALGGWHGGNDALGYYLKHPFSDEPFYDGVAFNYNDRNSVDIMMNEHGNQLAAVIVEPVLGAGGGLAPEADFLQYLREETERRDIILIFDEIITGFRFCYGSAGSDIYGVQPDLITLGKIAGGGMHLGVYGGREDVMGLAVPKADGGRWVGGGTFSSHPLTMVAGLATLSELRKRKEEYKKLNDRGEELRSKLNELFETNHSKLLATGTGSLVFVHWLNNPIEHPYTGADIANNLNHSELDRFQSRLVENGVFGYHGLGALSFEHTQDDVNETVDVISQLI